jgi:hypothetical protein
MGLYELKNCCCRENVNHAGIRTSKCCTVGMHMLYCMFCICTLPMPGAQARFNQQSTVARRTVKMPSSSPKYQSSAQLKCHKNLCAHPALYEDHYCSAHANVLMEGWSSNGRRGHTWGWGRAGQTIAVVVALATSRADGQVALGAHICSRNPPNVSAHS